MQYYVARTVFEFSIITSGNGKMEVNNAEDTNMYANKSATLPLR